MKSALVILSFLLSVALSDRSVILTCGGENEKGDRGPPGPPGKRGPGGRIGNRGLSGEIGPPGEIGDSVKSVEKRLDALEKLGTAFIPALDCFSYYNVGSRTNGVNGVFIDKQVTQVYCEQNIDRGGWLVFQNRFNGSVDFVRNWVNYQDGFGSPHGEYWLGLDALHYMTTSRNFQLRIELTDWNNEVRYAKYSTFEIGSADQLYRLTVGGYSGNAGDSMAHHNGHPFTTKDNDNDNTSGNCGTNGAWWYVACYDSNLNGWYLNGAGNTIRATSWGGWHGHLYSLKATKMMIKPI